jgi:hypothetical protein
MSRPPQQPFTRPIAEALGANNALGQLMERLRESQDRYTTIVPALPPALRAWVRPGMLDEEGWSLVVPNTAVAAKLRQSVPTLAQVLAEAGWPAIALRVKVQSGAR